MKKQSPVEQSSPVKHLCGGVGLMGAAYVLYKLSIIAYHVYLLLNPEMVKDPFALPLLFLFFVLQNGVEIVQNRVVEYRIMS